jgi:16S rRNA (uracil1498-N3)-methyltransferase
VERRDRSTVATFYADQPLAAGGRVELDDAAAQHAKVRRVQVGDNVRLTNGRGSIGEGSLERSTKTTALVAIDSVRAIAAPPRLRLFVPIADRERMLWLAEKSAELAVTEWQPVLFKR